MRPDEHKKKKSAAYRKKHNIQSDNKSGSTSQVKKDSGRTTKQLFDDGRQTSGRPTSQTEELVMSKVYDHNNWEKYKEAASSDIEADIPVHGADYEELLKATCNVKTQYQFRSFERDVQLPSEQLDECLSVDCLRLAESVRCLPLHQRLHIDQSLLDSDVDAYHAAVLDELSRHKQTKAGGRSAHGSRMRNVDTSRNCQDISDELKSPAVSDRCHPHQLTSSSSAAAAVNADQCSESVAAKALTQIEDELDLLLLV